MECKQFGSKFIVRCDKGDEIITTLKSICAGREIKLAAVTGIGAVNRATVGLFAPDTKEYHSQEFRKDMEIASLVGNISRMNGEVYTHLHITLTDGSYGAFGGHLNEAWVSCTAEIMIDVIDGEVDRAFSEEIGLNLLKF